MRQGYCYTCLAIGGVISVGSQSQGGVFLRQEKKHGVHKCFERLGAEYGFFLKRISELV